MDFWAILTQEHEGCDYTIGCGTKELSFRANPWDDAVERLKHTVIGFWLDPTDGNWPGYWDDKKLSSVLLSQVVRTASLPVQRWYEEGIELRYAQKEETEERRLYERLKQKYEEGNE